jgi:hypothetical protein
LIFFVFLSSHPTGNSKHYFVGKNREVLLHNTHGGTKYGDVEFSSYEVISESVARGLPFFYTISAIEKIRSGSEIFFLGICS